MKMQNQTKTKKTIYEPESLDITIAYLKIKLLIQLIQNLLFTNVYMLKMHIHQGTSKMTNTISKTPATINLQKGYIEKVTLKLHEN